MTARPISEATRKSIRESHAAMLAARERADRVSRPDGTDGGGHPGIEAANLEGYLGRFTLGLLDALEAAEATIAELEREVAYLAGNAPDPLSEDA